MSRMSLLAARTRSNGISESWDAAKATTRRAVFYALDRRGGRPILALVGTSYVTIRRRQLCHVQYDAAWIHTYRDGVVVRPDIASQTPSILRAQTRDNFLPQYVPLSGDTVFDVGAGIGENTLLFSELVGASGRVISLEAHPHTFECLATMVRLNGLKNVESLNVAVADKRGELFITNLESHLPNTVLTADPNGLRVRTDTLDTIASRLGVTKIDLLKMNIEGAERLAIEGMQGVIRNTRFVAISCHDFFAAGYRNDSFRTKSVVREFLVDNSFDVVTRDGDPRPWIRDTLYGRNRDELQ
jgi:FkbM family methyltransferase